MELLRGLTVISLLIVYLLLWAMKRRKQIGSGGIDPNILSKDNRPSQRFISRIANLLTLIVIGLILAHAMGTRDIPGFYYLAELSDSLSVIIGGALGTLGLSICGIAQKTMGAAWRVGIDTGTETHLVDYGVFSHCRNPTYLGLFLVCVAILFAFPTMAFLIWVVAFVLMLEFQVRMEEEHLLEIHGEAYGRYCRKVKRYIPWIY